MLSGFGSQFTTVAMAWQIYDLTNSPLQIGMIGLARALPQTILILVGLLNASRAIGSLAAAVTMTLLPPIRRTGRCHVVRRLRSFFGSQY